VSACSITPAEQVTWLLEHGMRAQGAPESHISAALAVLKERTAAMAAAAPAAEILAGEEQRYGTEPWYEPFRSSPEEVDFMRSIWDFDPLPVLARLRCPALALWGADDVHMPVPRCQREIRAALATANNGAFRLEVFPGADHRLRGPGGQFVPGYPHCAIEWLNRVTGTRLQEGAGHAGQRER
jgi:pimeloyl-ACP methyl ester carboxylesterase